MTIATKDIHLKLVIFMEAQGSEIFPCRTVLNLEGHADGQILDVTSN